VRRRGTTNFGAEHAAERSPGCDGVAGSTIVRRYSGHVSTTIPYISMTSLYCTRHAADRQPVKLNQAVSYMVARPEFENQPSCGILDTVQNTEGGLWRAS